MDPLNQLSLGFIKQSGMADYFKSHLSDLGMLKLKFYVLLYIIGVSGGCLNFDTVSILTRGMLCQMGI